MELAAAKGFDVKVVTLPRGQDPADAPDGLRGAAGRRRELPPLPSPARARARGGPAGGVRPGARDPREGRGLARAPGGAPPARRPARPPPGDARGTGAGARGRREAPVEAPRLLEAGERLERETLAACVAHPSLVRGLAELTAEHFDSEANRQLPRRARRREGRPGADRAAGPSSTPGPHGRRSTSEPAPSSSCDSASGS